MERTPEPTADTVTGSEWDILTENEPSLTAKPATKTESNSETKLEPATKTESNPETKLEPATKTESKSNLDSESKPETNVRAEWEALKSKAAGEVMFHSEEDDKLQDYEKVGLSPEEIRTRERNKRIGARLMRALDLLSESADDGKLAGRIERTYRMAEIAGIKGDLDRSVDFHLKNYFEGPAKALKRFEKTEPGWEGRKEKLIENAIELKGADLSKDFPSGNYLFHGSDVRHLSEIIPSGSLMNALAVSDFKHAEKVKKAEAEGKNPDDIPDEIVSANSGAEGISWSMNGIDALPGTPGHLAGFLASPESALAATGDQLVIPSRPAPYEVLQVSPDVNAEAFFEAKKQVEVWGDRSAHFGDMASVDTNLIFLGMNGDFAESQMRTFLDNGGRPAEELRAHYSVDENDKITLDEQLHQQKSDENLIPPGAVYLQSLIDRGKLKDLFEAAKVTDSPDSYDVNSLIERLKTDAELRTATIREARKESNEYLERYEKEFDAAKSIEIPLSEMYFVSSHADLPAWAEMFARSGVEPKGIVLYDDPRVILPNFASAYKGNHDELTREIGDAVKVDGDFWNREFGMDVENMERAGSQGQVLREADVRHDKEIRMVDGKLAITTPF